MLETGKISEFLKDPTTWTEKKCDGGFLHENRGKFAGCLHDKSFAMKKPIYVVFMCFKT